MNGLSVICCVILIYGIEARPSGISSLPERGLNRNRGIVGIASIAGVTSRNGRVSSIGGIKIFPETDSNNEYFYPLEISSEKDTRYPITVTSEKDGRYASGTVQIKPGYVAASARAGFNPPGSRNTYNSLNFAANQSPQRPFNEYFFQPQPDLFMSRSMDNWFSKDFFQGFRPPSPEIMRNEWLINDFNPFIHFWR